MKRKMTFPLFILSIVYCTGCFFVLGVIIRTVIEFKNLGVVEFNFEKIIHLFKMSGVAGIASSNVAWIFAKIDERKSQETPPSDPKV